MNELMQAGDIAFPKLGIYLSNVPKSFTIFGYTIALYGVIIAIGIFLGFCMADSNAKRDGLPKDILWDFSIYAIVCSILGARIYYVVFAWDYYKDNLLQVFNIRGGGLAIYGGVIAGFTTLFVFSKVRKQSFFTMADSAGLGLLVGQSIGRWGNFTNREAFGEYSNGLLAMRLPVEAVRSHEITDLMKSHMTEGTNYIQVHPTFLYESLWNASLLCVLLFARRYKRFDGEVALWYIGGYGVGRLWIEGLRTDQLKLFGTNLAVSQCVAIACILFAVAMEIVVRMKIKKKEGEKDGRK